MHEYAQDAMTYVRAYGRPDLLQYDASLSFPIHERHPTVVHLAVHLGEWTACTLQQIMYARALVPLSATTLTAFYSLCQDDLFAKTLLYSEVPKFYTWNASTKGFNVAVWQLKDIPIYIPVMHWVVVHCSSEQYRMLLSKIAVDQYTWTNILSRFKNSQRSAVRYLSPSLPRTKSS
ncbi:uncharacterized protein LOC104236095 [Trichonephila clavipes]|nr:uncharacterized protein LOC104236095 [Trichonephila clavipes]